MISRKDIDCGKEFDWGLTSENYAKYIIFALQLVKIVLFY